MFVTAIVAVAAIGYSRYYRCRYCLTGSVQPPWLYQRPEYLMNSVGQSGLLNCICL